MKLLVSIDKHCAAVNNSRRTPDRGKPDDLQLNMLDQHPTGEYTMPDLLVPLTLLINEEK